MEIPGLGFLKNFRSSIDALKNEVAAIEKKLELSRQRREKLQVLPLTKAETIELLCAWVHTEAAKYPAALKTHIDTINRTTNPVTGLPTYGHDGSQLEILTIREAGKRGEISCVQSCLTFFLKDVLCSGIERAINDMPAWEAGPPRAERVAELDRLDREIAELEDKLSEMAKTAADAGVSIQISPANKPKAIPAWQIRRGRWSDDKEKSK